MIRLVSRLAAAKGALRVMNKALDTLAERRLPKRRARSRMRNVPAMAMGAGAMYLLDRKNGAERREMLMKKSRSAMEKARGAMPEKLTSEPSSNVPAKPDDQSVAKVVEKNKPSSQTSGPEAQKDTHQTV